MKSRIWGVIISLLLVSGISVAQNKKVERWASSVAKFSTQLTKTKYAASKILGEPDVLPNGGESPNAWTPVYINKEEWIKVAFDTTMHIRQIAIGESFGVTALSKVYAYDSRGKEHLIKELAPAELPVSGRMLNLFMDITPYEVKYIKLVLKRGIIKGFSSIDAVGISNSTEPMVANVNIAENINQNVAAEKLDENVNSQYKETKPILSTDGKTLYFSRIKHPDNTKGKKDKEDIWYSTFNDEKQNWSDPQNLALLNTKGQNFVNAAFTDENKEVLVLGNIYGKKGKMHQGVSISKRPIKDTTATWSSPEALKITGGYNLTENADYFISSDGEFLLTSVERTKSIGLHDIYISFKRGRNLWTKPLNLGNAVNTSNMECSPFLSQNNKTLYFSSKGYSGYGGYDIFICQRLDDTWTNWTVPKNLGPKINSTFDDQFFSTSTDEYQGFFSKGVSEDNADLYRIDLKEFLILPTIRMKGTVTSSDSLARPIKASIIVTKDSNGNQLDSVGTDNKGMYKVLIPIKDSYHIDIMATGFESDTSAIDFTGFLDIADIDTLINFTLKEIPKPIIPMGSTLTADSTLLANNKSRQTETANIAERTNEVIIVSNNAISGDSIKIDPNEEKALMDITDAMTTNVPASKRGKISILFDIIYFGFDKNSLSDKSFNVLEKLIRYVNENESLKLEVAGHTDDVGEEDYNQELSEERAKEVAKYLIKKGLHKDNISIIGFGESKPTAMNDTVLRRAKNRRVEIRIIK